MSLAEQALWSEAAATTLSASLLLPPLSSTPEEELFSTAFLPHIQHILAWQRSIHDRISNSKRVNGGSLWSSFNRPYTMSRTRAITNMKFSLVLAHAGLFTDAKQLQVPVKDYALKILGIEHKATRGILLALANTYWNLGQLDQAKSILTRILETCETVLGSDDHETLLTKGALGETLFMYGCYTEARNLQAVREETRKPGSVS